MFTTPTTASSSQKNLDAVTPSTSGAYAFFPLCLTMLIFVISLGYPITPVRHSGRHSGRHTKFVMGGRLGDSDEEDDHDTDGATLTQTS